MVNIFVSVHLMGIGSVPLVSPKVSMAHQLLEFTHPSYFISALGGRYSSPHYIDEKAEAHL